MTKLGGWMFGGLMVSAMIAASACTTELAEDSGDPSDPSTSTELAPLATVNLANGSVVKMIELAPGLIDIMQVLPRGVAPIDTGRWSPVEVFEQLAPGEPVPAALAAAEARRDAKGTRPIVGERAPIVVPGPLDPTTEHSRKVKYADFVAQFCAPELDYPFSNCYKPQSGNHFGTGNDVDHFKVAVCVDTGRVKLKLAIDGDIILSQDVLALQGCLMHGWETGWINADNFTDEVDVEQSGTVYDLSTKWSH